MPQKYLNVCHYCVLDGWCQVPATAVRSYVLLQQACMNNRSICTNCSMSVRVTPHCSVTLLRRSGSLRTAVLRCYDVLGHTASQCYDVLGNVALQCYDVMGLAALCSVTTCRDTWTCRASASPGPALQILLSNNDDSILT